MHLNTIQLAVKMFTLSNLEKFLLFVNQYISVACNFFLGRQKCNSRLRNIIYFSRKQHVSVLWNNMVLHSQNLCNFWLVALSSISTYIYQHLYQILFLYHYVQSASSNLQCNKICHAMDNDYQFGLNSLILLALPLA